MARFIARRFCDAHHRPDCFELVDTLTNTVMSPGCYRYEAERAARRLNREARMAAKTERAE